MAVPSILIWVTLMACAVVAYRGLVSGFISARKAQFRVELWTLRDDLMDNLFVRRQEPPRDARDVLEAVEICIKQSDNFSILRISSIYFFWRQAGSPRPASKLALKPTGDPELDVYRDRLALLAGRYAFRTLLIGPLLVIAVPVALFVGKCLRWLSAPRTTEQPRYRPATEVAARPARVDLQADAWANRASASAELARLALTR